MQGGAGGTTPDEGGKSADTGGQVATPVGNQDGGSRPLIMAGKKTLFERVLSKPGARFASAPGAQADGAPVPAFSVFYVYARKVVGGTPWVEVGASSDGHRDGWLPLDKLSDWKQSLVLKFTERSGRSPVMFLRDPEQVELYLADSNKARNAVHQAQFGDSTDPEIVAIEPAASAIPRTSSTCCRSSIRARASTPAASRCSCSTSPPSTRATRPR